MRRSIRLGRALMRTAIPTRLFARSIAAFAALAAACAIAAADPMDEPQSNDTPDLVVLQPAEHAPPMSPEEQAALRDALTFDGIHAPGPAARAMWPSAVPEVDWNRAQKLDGSSSVTVKRPLPVWDAKANAGADFARGTSPGSGELPGLPPPMLDDGTAAAWANLSLGGLASVDARVDPSQQRKLGATLGPSLPLGRDYSVALQNTMALTETPAGVPVAPGTAVTPGQVWSNDTLVKFNVLSTGTSFAAGTTTTTVDSATRGKVSAEQKLFDALSVTTSVTDVGAKAPAKSIGAGFKLTW